MLSLSLWIVLRQSNSSYDNGDMTALIIPMRRLRQGILCHPYPYGYISYVGRHLQGPCPPKVNKIPALFCFQRGQDGSPSVCSWHDDFIYLFICTNQHNAKHIHDWIRQLGEESWQMTNKAKALLMFSKVTPLNVKQMIKDDLGTWMCKTRMTI